MFLNKNRQKKYRIINNTHNDLIYSENFRISNARLLLEFSALSYNRNINRIEEDLEKINYKLAKFICIDNSECIICYNSENIVVAFCGTEADEISDVIIDINFLLVKSEIGKIHSGFYNVYKKLKFPVFREILTLIKEKERNVYFTGHSLGGALALIFGIFFKKGTIYTFGQPMIGGKDLYEKYKFDNIIFYRVVSPKDFIIKLPPKFLGYFHLGIECRIELPFNISSIIPNFILNVFLKNTIILKILFFLFSNILFSHSLNHYRKLLWSKDAEIFIIKKY